jgi:outer membrane protein assembly factor BamA
VEIDIIGNKGIGERKIKSLMETKTAGFFSRGVFNEEKLKTDLEKIISYYKNHGYPEIEIKNWRIDFNRDKSKMFLLLEIAEGPFYRFGKVGVTGNKLFSSSELTQVLKAKEGKPYSQEKTERDKMMITTKYLNKGYLGCEVIPEVTFKKEQGAVNITYKITEGDVYSIDNIYIRGNTYTKEKVIRRELEFKEGEILDYSKIMKSIYKLYQLGYFSSVDREIRPSVEPNKVDVIIEVKEREQRRWLNLGASYSQVDKLVFFLEVNWDNLFGAGKKLYIKTEGGAEKLQGEVGFVEPYLFDKPIYSKIRAYLLKKDYEFYEEIYGKEKNVVGKVAYDTTERGCELTSGWEIVTFHRLYTTYEIKKTTYRLIPLPPETLEPKLPSKVGGKEVRWPEGAKEKTRQEYQKILKETFGEENYQKYYHEYQKWRNNWESWNREHNKFYTLEGNPFWKHRAYHPGSYVARNFFWKDGGVIEKKEVHPLTSSISNAYVWDTYNDPYNTTQGFRLRLYNKIAGLGGDEHFIKNSVSFGVYFPLKFGLVLGFYFDFGVIKGYNRKDVPPLERYWLGGANTVRGYAEYELGRGFRSRFFSNIELKLPLEDGAITPLIFFDAGAGWCAQEEAPQSWREIFNQVDFQKLRFGTGVELRIRTPAVPLRIGFGWKLGPLKKGQSRTQLHFSMGQMF